MALQVPGVAVRIATAIPGLEAHPAYAISFSDQARADPYARQTTTARRVSLAPIPVTQGLHVGAEIAFLFRRVHRLISSLVERGDFARCLLLQAILETG